VLSQVKRVIRTNYSNPPTHGAIVAAVLNSPELRAQWEAELAEMRLRIRGMRSRWSNCWRKSTAARLQLRRSSARHVLLLRPDR
jgi:aromatic-amino-acid transaminase